MADLEAIARPGLRRRPGFWNGRGVRRVTNRKLAAIAYIDDRAVRFEDRPRALRDLNLTEEN